MSEPTRSYTYYWCEECGWDTVRASASIKGPCPLCAGDTGRDGDMQKKPCPADQGPVEGHDDRTEGGA